jgi:26S proteasome regulatory subunit N1
MGAIHGTWLGAALPGYGIKRSEWRNVLLVQTGLQDASDATLETLKAIPHPIAKTAQIIVEACAFAGTGNVLKVQAMLHYCDEHIDSSSKDKEKEEKEKEKDKDGKEGDQKRDDTFQSFAVIGIALIAMGEDVGAEMSLRQFNHLVRCRDYV